MIKKIILVFGISMGLYASPSVKWKSFEVGAPPQCGGPTWCATVVAPTAIRASGLSMTPTVVDPFTAWGSNSDTTVVVKCSVNPNGGMNVTVFSASNNAQSSGMWRDDVSMHMLGVGCY